MKIHVSLFVIVSFFTIAIADRIVSKGGNQDFAFITSLKYPLGQAPAGEENDAFAVVFGKGYPGRNLFPPSVSVTYAKGTKSVTDAGNTFEGSLSGLLWSYYTLGEYCELNNVPGYQAIGDVLIQSSDYTTTVWNPVESGEVNGVYYATLSEATGVFYFTCRVSGSERVDGNIAVGPFSIKCDVIVNATNYWDKVTICPDSSRYVGLLAYVAAAKIDVSVGADLNTNFDAQGQGSITFDGAQSFLKWKNTFENGQTGVEYNVNAQITDITSSLTGLPVGVTAINQVVFSFLSPKSQTNLFVWDPEMGVDVDKVNQVNGQEKLTVFNLLIVVLLAFFFAY